MGILGGTFNPPHVGHLALARHARAELDLERVLLMPASVAPNKPIAHEDPGAEHRLQMCRLAVAHEPGVEASALEIERGECPIRWIPCRPSMTSNLTPS